MESQRRWTCVANRCKAPTNRSDTKKPKRVGFFLRGKRAAMRKVVSIKNKRVVTYGLKTMRGEREKNIGRIWTMTRLDENIDKI